MFRRISHQARRTERSSLGLAMLVHPQALTIPHKFLLSSEKKASAQEVLLQIISTGNLLADTEEHARGLVQEA